MKLLSLELPGVVVKKAGKARVAVPSVANGPHGHWAAKAGRAKKQRTAAEKRLQAMLGGKVLLVARITRVAPRKLDDDNLRGALKAYRDGVADALGLANDRPGWLQWEYEQEQCPMGEPERVRLEVSAKDPDDHPQHYGTCPYQVGGPCTCSGVPEVAPPPMRSKRGPQPAYTPPRTDFGMCKWFAGATRCEWPRFAHDVPWCAGHYAEHMEASAKR